MPDYSTPKNKRQKLLRKRFGRNYRSKFYGDISGYQHGVVKKVNKLRKRIAAGSYEDVPERAHRRFERLEPVAQDVVAKRRKFDAKHGNAPGIGAGSAKMDTSAAPAFTSHGQTSRTVKVKRGTKRTVRRS